MQKVIVTGGAGFIGSHIVDALIVEGYDVHIVDNMSAGKKENVNNKATLHVVDIRDKEKLISVFKNAYYVFHEAALPQVQYSIENPIETNDVNVNGLLCVLEAARINNVKRVIFASSCAVYGDQKTLPVKEDFPVLPLSPYAMHKYIGERYCSLWSLIYDLETVCLRYFNVYGDRTSLNGSYPLVIAKFLDLKKKGKPLIIVGDGKNTRDYVNVLDVVRANVLAMKSEKVYKGEVINIGTGIQTSINQIADMIGGSIENIPPRIELKNIEADILKARELLNWQPEIKLQDWLENCK